MGRAGWWRCGLCQGRMSVWDQLRGIGKRKSCVGSEKGKLCVCVCAHSCAGVSGAVLSDSAVSPAWLFPCTWSNSTWSHKKQINFW